jgi:hypothetical protein
MGAELSRKRGGKKTRTGMSESQLEEFASKELDTSFIGDEVMEKNVIKSITKYLGKTDKDFKTALDAFSTKPKTSEEAAAHGYPKGLAPEERSKYDEAAARIKPPKRVISKEDGYPPTKGERRDAKRTKAKKMKVTGAGTRNLQRIIGQKAEAAGSVDKLIKSISTYLKEDTPKYNKKAVDTEIKRDKSIGKKEAKAIHGLLRGRQKSDS